MKTDIHPEYRFVVFRDVSVNFTFLTRSCVSSSETVTYEGEEYPVVAIDVSSESHPFYTGTQKALDREGRVERFRRKYGFASGMADEGAAAPDEGAEPAKS
jgi:large subunit ribosomal protein L31